MIEEELTISLSSDAHVFVTKEREFVQADLAKEAQTGCIAIPPSGKFSTSPTSGSLPSHIFRRETGSYASYKIFTGVASTKRSPRYHPKRKQGLVRPYNDSLTAF